VAPHRGTHGAGDRGACGPGATHTPSKAIHAHISASPRHGAWMAPSAELCRCGVGAGGGTAGRASDMPLPVPRRKRSSGFPAPRPPGLTTRQHNLEQVPNKVGEQTDYGSQTAYQ
jgi:hypothetical protein